MPDPYPHCARCDLADCDGFTPVGTLESYIAQAGMKPKEPIMRSAWEHGLMVWCRAQKEILK